MSTSPNLGISLLASSQSSKYVTVNEAIDDLDEALCGELAVTMTDADYDLSATQFTGNFVFVFTGTLTASRNIIAPASKRPFVVVNDTAGGFAVVVKTSAGGSTGPTIANSASTYNWLYSDGTNIVQLGASASGATAFTGLSDCPASYSGAAHDAVQVNAAGNALEFVAKPFDVAFFAPGLGSNSQKLLRVGIARAVKFPSGAAASIALASVAATSDTTFTFKQNGTSFATVKYSASSATGTFTQASDATFAAGDLLEVDGPSTADASLADVGITLAGIRL